MDGEATNIHAQLVRSMIISTANEDMYRIKEMIGQYIFVSKIFHNVSNQGITEYICKKISLHVTQNIIGNSLDAMSTHDILIHQEGMCDEHCH